MNAPKLCENVAAHFVESYHCIYGAYFKHVHVASAQDINNVQYIIMSGNSRGPSRGMLAFAASSLLPQWQPLGDTRGARPLQAMSVNTHRPRVAVDALSPLRTHHTSPIETLPASEDTMSSVDPSEAAAGLGTMVQHASYHSGNDLVVVCVMHSLLHNMRVQAQQRWWIIVKHKQLTMPTKPVGLRDGGMDSKQGAQLHHLPLP